MSETENSQDEVIRKEYEFKKQVSSFFMSKGYLISPGFLDNLPTGFDCEFFLKLLEKHLGNNITVLTKDILNSIILNEKMPDINWKEFEKARVAQEKGRDNKVYDTFLNIINYKQNNGNISNDLIKLVKAEEPENDLTFPEDEMGSNVVIVKSYAENSQKREVQDFVSYFRKRYDALKKILQTRMELENAISISRLKNVENESVALIGMINGRRITKNGNLIFEIEDLTGKVNVLVNKNRKDLFEKAEYVVLDEVVGVKGKQGKGMVFVDELIFPDVPLTKEYRKASEEVYAAFTADFHTGSMMYLKEDVEKFLKWVNCEIGSDEQKRVAKNLKYLFIVGDVVDGVGVYPNQENDLMIQDIYEQYKEFVEVIKKIPSYINVIISPGNHDSTRISEPQPALHKEFVSELYDLPNVKLVSNPSIVNIHSSKSFPGFDVLVYHGSSFIYYGDQIDKIRSQGGTKRTDLIMKLLLQKRHLAPTHTSTLYIPFTEEDPLVIERVPDFFITGHLHRTVATTYNNITLIGCSCWQGRTENMEKLGIYPDPSRLTVVNLNTREMKMLNFK